MRFLLIRRNCRRRDEQGAVLILGALFAVVAIIAAALSVDIGSLVLSKRSNQRVADLASLDGVRGLRSATNQRQTVEQMAVESARRNGFTTTWTAAACPLGGSAATFYNADHSSWLRVEVGHETTPTGFAPVPCPISYALESLVATITNPVDAVRVTASSPVSFSFMPGGGRETATGVSTLAVVPGTPATPAQTTNGLGHAGVQVGSTAVSINTAQASLLNTVLQTAGNPAGVPLGNPPGNLAVTALGYQGLATAHVSAEELATELGISAGTVDQVLAAGFGYDDLLTATADILDRNNNDAAAVTVRDIYSRTIPLDFDARHQNIDLGQFTGAVSGGAQTFNGSSVADTEFSVLDLIRGGALLSDGDHLVTVPLTGTVPLPTGATVASAKVQVIEAPQHQFGSPTFTVHTSQLNVTLTLRVPVSVAGLGVLNVDLPLSIQGGGADATMFQVDCPGTATVPTNVWVRAVTRALSAQTGAWSVSALAGTVTISANAGSLVTAPGSTSPNWAVPPAFTDTHTVAPAALPGLTLSSSSITVGGVLPLGTTLSSVTSTIVNTVNPVLAQLNGTIMPPLYNALGVGFSSADVQVRNATNGGPVPDCTPGTYTPGTSGTVDSLGDLPVLTE